jgi:ubiquinone/menaquinone biosynthesis C-methylase UbiE
MAERAHPHDKGFQNTFFGLTNNPYRKALFERYSYCNDYIIQKEVIDVPCGTGWGTSLLKNAKNIIGIDIDQDSIDFANNMYRSDKLKFQVGNMKKLNLADNICDVLICLEGFEHVSQQTGQEFLIETKRVLRDNGIFIMTCPIIKKGGLHSGNPHHIYEYPEEELLKILNDNFYCMRIEEIENPDNPIIRFIGKTVKYYI